MRRLDWVLRALAAMMMLLSLGSAPVLDALTHDPGTLSAEADHSAWHAEKGETWQGDSHQHHDSTDHDHSISIIVASENTETFVVRTVIELSDLPVLSGAIRDGPRRPPRETV